MQFEEVFRHSKPTSHWACLQHWRSAGQIASWRNGSACGELSARPGFDAQWATDESHLSIRPRFLDRVTFFAEHRSVHVSFVVRHSPWRASSKTWLPFFVSNDKDEGRVSTWIILQLHQTVFGFSWIRVMFLSVKSVLQQKMYSAHYFFLFAKFRSRIGPQRAPVLLSAASSSCSLRPTIQRIPAGGCKCPVHFV